MKKGNKESGNQIKIKLTTALIFALIIVIIIVGIIIVMLNVYKNMEKSEENPIEEFQKKEVSEVKEETDNNTSKTEEEYAPEKQENNEAINFNYEDIAFQFLKMENNKQNIIYSPLSIKYALKMISDGAKGSTKEQIDNIIGDADIAKYDNIENVLSLANTVYIRDTYMQNVNEEYKNTLSNNYNAEIIYDEFESANNINNWIAEKTFGQIEDMVSDEEVQNGDSKMFLINALAIDMEWKSKFDSDKTKGDVFYLENGEEMEATQMSRKAKGENTLYYKDDDITAISMDLKKYENSQMEFIGIMPNENLSGYIENFDWSQLENITNNLTPASEMKGGIKIYMPKFSLEYNLHLKDDLNALGIKDAFDSETADFSEMSRKDQLYIKNIMHKANIDFSEEGVKAAAVTTGTAGITSVDTDKPMEIKIDKPFMYFIREKNTNEIWFAGAVYEPNHWENDKAEYE